MPRGEGGWRTGRDGLLLVFMLAVVAVGFRFIWWLTPWLLPARVLGGVSTSDRISAASAFFSALALAGLIFTIVLQQRQIRLQREEQDKLEAQVQEQRRHLRTQTRALASQAFEGTFFFLLRLHNENVRSQEISLGPQEPVHRGKMAFRVCAEELRGRCLEAMRDAAPAELTVQDLNRLFDSVCETPYADFGHYFRNLYHVVKYIDSASIRNKQRYAAHVRAQLSQPEFVLFFFNGLRRAGGSKFKPLMEKYALLHEMRLDPTFAQLTRMYEPGAFGARESGPA